MSKVFTSEATGAAVYVFSDDHCPPHVHARHRGDGWVARASFSFLRNAVELMSIQPLGKAPLLRTVNHLLDDIQGRLSDCRRCWWHIRRTTCLKNEWARVPAPGKVVISDHVPGAKQIEDAEYGANAGQLSVSFCDGTTETVRLQS